MSSNWLTHLTGLHRVTSRRDRRRLRSAPPHRRTLRAEALEDRVVPATPTITWDGGGGNFNWNTAANWTGDVLPAPTDDVEIGGGFAAATISATGNVSIHSLTSQASLTISGGTFSIADTS